MAEVGTGVPQSPASGKTQLLHEGRWERPPRRGSFPMTACHDFVEKDAVPVEPITTRFLAETVPQEPLPKRDTGLDPVNMSCLIHETG